MLRRALLFTLSLAALVGLPVSDPAVALDIKCASSETDLLSTDSPDADPLCMLGDRKALTVFIRFKSDTSGTSWDSSACYQWRETPQSTLMPWMSSFLASYCSDPGNCPGTTTSCAAATVDTFAVEPSMTDYYDEMSGGKHWLWGTVHSSVQVTDNPRSSYASGLVGIGEANLEILTRLDSSVDFSQYDRNPLDGYVDQIFMIYRTFRGDSQGFTGYAWLAGPLSAATDSTFTTNDWNGSEYIKIDLRFTGRRPGGVTLEGQNLHLAIQQAAHEAGHNFFTRGSEGWRFNHIQYISTFGVMDGYSGEAGLPFCAFERERMGWISPTSVSSTQTGLSLNDAFRGGSAVKIPLRDSTEFFLIENRAKKSWYDRDHSDLYECDFDALPNRGGVIYHVDLNGSDDPGVGPNRWHKLVDVEVAEGLFDTSGVTALDRTEPNPFYGLDSLDTGQGRRPAATHTFGNGNANTFATYTAPNTNRYIEVSAGNWRQTGYTAVNVQNITLSAADSTLTFDVVIGDSSKANHVFRPSSGAYTGKWAGWLYLVGDVSVDSLVTLDVASGTTVKSRYSYDQSALQTTGGLDAGRTELRISGGATLDVNGASGSLATFTSTRGTPAAGDWYGIDLKANASLALTYGDVGHGLYGVSSASSPTSFVIENSKVHHHSELGVYAVAKQATFEIKDSEIYSNGYAGISLSQKKELAGSPQLLTKIFRNKIYSNDAGGGNEVELMNLGGTGIQIDSLKNNAIGSSGNYGEYGLYSDRATGGGTGSHKTIGYRDTVAYFSNDGITLLGLASSELDRLVTKEIQTRALVVTGAATVELDSSKFEGTNYTHVWNDTLSTTCLGDTSSAGACPGINALFSVAADTVVWNWNTPVTLKAENNWWDYNLCSIVPPPAKKFYGPVDRDPRLCTQPSLARPGDDFWPEGGEGEIPSQLRIAASPNPFSSGVVIRYAVPGGEDPSEVEVSVFDVAGRLVESLVNGRQPAGSYEFHWHPGTAERRLVPPGIYFVRLAVGTQVRTAKVVLTQ